MSDLLSRQDVSEKTIAVPVERGSAYRRLHPGLIDVARIGGPQGDHLEVALKTLAMRTLAHSMVMAEDSALHDRGKEVRFELTEDAVVVLTREQGLRLAADLCAALGAAAPDIPRAPVRVEGQAGMTAIGSAREPLRIAAPMDPGGQGRPALGGREEAAPPSISVAPQPMPPSISVAPQPMPPSISVAPQPMPPSMPVAPQAAPAMIAVDPQAAPAMVAVDLQAAPAPAAAPAPPEAPATDLPPRFGLPTLARGPGAAEENGPRPRRTFGKRSLAPSAVRPMTVPSPAPTPASAPPISPVIQALAIQDKLAGGGGSGRTALLAGGALLLMGGAVASAWLASTALMGRDVAARDMPRLISAPSAATLPTAETRAESADALATAAAPASDTGPEAAAPATDHASGTVAPSSGLVAGLPTPMAGLVDGTATPTAGMVDGTATPTAGMVDGTPTPTSGMVAGLPTPVVETAPPGGMAASLALPVPALDAVPADRSAAPRVEPAAALAEGDRAAAGAWVASTVPATERMTGTTAVVPPAAAAVSSATATAQPRLVVRARADSWVQVRDARGEVLFARMMRSGEEWIPPAAAGLRLTTGNAGGTEIVLDGASLPPLGPVGQVRRDIPLDQRRS